ncbi:NAD(P)-binding protein [Punctularia strigosozonata HHB-11173 SS5]|uniref:NAD(P)-binding protein n=1 Tax=Punctularia strigosozonata (strain HHB-11173) TaxID=741275 RepID=UPI00044172B1|nr:NAD(P)-binding protein [Punctularia strigosozonata HHB-11173 SS5]EIN12416.1 NAD(P)-binding protein [Punctularia strigosozonata HHB-11173 SS5]
MGAIYSQYTQIFPPKSTWSVDNIPDLSGKVMIVTGGNSGIGKETALLGRNAKVYLAARDESKAEEAIRELKEETGREAVFLKLDLGDLRSVKRAAEEFLRREKRLDVLFNNAGVAVPPMELVTDQGYDLQFGTNVLGHFYLTKLLLPVLLSTAGSTHPGKTRVVNTSSVAHYHPFGPPLDFDTFKDSPKRRKTSKVKLYAQSKFGNVVFANELERRYGTRGIVSTSLHPGVIKTNISRNNSPLLRSLINMIYPHASHGALTQLWAGTSQEGLELGGKYLIPWARIGTPYGPTNDPALGRDLWVWMEEQVQDI